MIRWEKWLQLIGVNADFFNLHNPTTGLIKIGTIILPLIGKYILERKLMLTLEWDISIKRFIIAY